MPFLILEKQADVGGALWGEYRLVFPLLELFC